MSNLAIRLLAFALVWLLSSIVMASGAEDSDAFVEIEGPIQFVHHDEATLVVMDQRFTLTQFTEVDGRLVSAASLLNQVSVGQTLTIRATRQDGGGYVVHSLRRSLSS